MRLKRGTRPGLSLSMEDQFIVFHVATGMIATIKPVAESKLKETLKSLEHLGELQVFKLGLAVVDEAAVGNKDIIRMIGRKNVNEIESSETKPSETKPSETNPNESTPS